MQNWGFIFVRNLLLFFVWHCCCNMGSFKSLVSWFVVVHLVFVFKRKWHLNPHLVQLNLEFVIELSAYTKHWSAKSYFVMVISCCIPWWMQFKEVLMFDCQQHILKRPAAHHKREIKKARNLLYTYEHYKSQWKVSLPEMAENWVCFYHEADEVHHPLFL